MSIRTYPIVLTALSAALAGCNGPQEDRESTSGGITSVATSQPDETQVASIIRPEVDNVPEIPVVPVPFELTLGFPDGGTMLGDESETALAELLASPQYERGWPITLRGHSDSSGNDADNLAVSRRRAEAVAEWLVGKGVDKDRITIIPLGEMRPIAPNAHLDGTPDEEGRARNRRVDIVIAPPVEIGVAEQRLEAGAKKDDAESETGS